MPKPKEMSEKVSHTLEPWAIDRDDRPGMEWNNHIISVTHPHLTICFMSHTPDDLNDEGEANARRIVACVNACKGISTEMLEHVGTDIMPAAVNYRTLRQQRDQLAGALAVAIELFENFDECTLPGTDAHAWAVQSRTLLASLKEQEHV